MTRTLNRTNQRGFSLIEAMFSAIVLAVGLLALAGFHAVALKDGTLLKMRMVATNLAQEKVEDLKTFSRLQDDPATSAVDECATAPCYTDIAANAGGQKSSGALILPSGTVTVSNTAYTRSWTVTCYTAGVGAAPSVTANCATADFKIANVSIAWTDTQGGAQSTNLQAVIHGTDPANAGRALANRVPTASPTVTYTGSTSGEGSTQLDSGTQKSSKPLPTVSSKGYSLSTSFETVIYDTNGRIVSRQENQTVNCVCEFIDNPSAAYPASYFYWNGASLAIKTPSSTVTKKIGHAPSINGDTQGPLCDVCCRDHHDSQAPGTSSPTTALYDPFRPTADYDNGDHKHYYYTDSDCETNPNASGCDKNAGIQAVDSGLYLESCRMIRVNGIWRAMQDWRLNDLVVLPPNYLTTDSTKTLYETYKSNLMRYIAYSDCNAAGGAACSSITQSTAPSKTTMTGRNLTNQEPLKFNQLLAYAMYIDQVYKEGQPRTLDDNYYTTLRDKIVEYQSNPSKLGWRDMMSFNEPNVTLFATWASDCTSNPAQTGVVKVLNETIKNIDASTLDYYGVYRRGLTQVQADTVADDYCADFAIIGAYMLPSNSGLNGGVARESYFYAKNYNASTLADLGNVGTTYGTYSYYPLALGTDRHDHALANRKIDYLNIYRTSNSSTSTNVMGLITSGNSSANATVTVTAVSSLGGSTSCTVSTTGTTGSFTGTFNCPVGNNWSGTVTISSTATGAFFDHSSSTTDFTYNTEKNDGFTSSFSASVTTTSDSAHQFWVFGPTISISGACTAGGYATSLCDDAKVTVSADGTDPSTADNANCVIGSSPTCSGMTLNASRTWTGRIGVTSSQTGAAGKPSHWDGDNTCSDGATSAGTVRYTGTFTVGPADAPSSFSLCVSDE